MDDEEQADGLHTVHEKFASYPDDDSDDMEERGRRGSYHIWANAYLTVADDTKKLLGKCPSERDGAKKNNTLGSS